MKFKATVNTIIFLLKLLPMKKQNYHHIIRQQYGSPIMRNVFQYGKYQLKMCKTRLHLDYLRICKREKLIPKFVRFKIPSTHQRYRRAINNCYEQMIVDELRSKKRELSQLYRQFKNLRSSIVLDLNHFTVCRIEKIISKLVVHKETQIKITHLKKTQ